MRPSCWAFKIYLRERWGGREKERRERGEGRGERGEGREGGREGEGRGGEERVGEHEMLAASLACLLEG